MSKIVKSSVILLAVLLVAYNSVYVKKLSDMKAKEEKTFDARAYAKEYLFKKIPQSKDRAIELARLYSDLKNNPRKAFGYSNAQNDGNNRFFMVKAEGEVLKIDESNAYLKVKGLPSDVILATVYIIGNAARDGSGIISVDEFVTTMDMNTVSEEINKLIRTEVLPPFEAKLKIGSRVSFVGCVELNQTRPVPSNLEVIPLIVDVK